MTTPSSAGSVSSASYPVDNSRPSSCYFVVAPIVCAAAVTSTAFAYSVAAFSASRAALTSAATFSLRLFSTNYVTRSLASSFLFYVVFLSNFSKSKARHSGGHDSNTIKIASSVAMKGSLVHYCTRSFHTLM